MCESASEYRVLLIGASGQFGQKLAKLLAAEPSIQLILAGRRHNRLVQLQQQLPGTEILAVDRDSVDAALLQSSQIDLVADLSGPFHDMQTGLVEAAIMAGAHYIDIADSNDFIKAVTALDNRAADAGVAVISGASSTPALSHAVIDSLTRNWMRIDSIDATIRPSNSQQYGLSIIENILGRVGKPYLQFKGGAWRSANFWSDARRRNIPGVGSQFGSTVETPDTDLFVSSYHPTLKASFRASLELSVMHLGVSCMAWLVAHRVMQSAQWLSRPLQWIANRLSVISNHHGGMLVSVTGKDKQGHATLAEWSLSAKDDAGPHVPILASLICIRNLASGKLDITGAMPCIGLVDLEDFDIEFDTLDITTQRCITALPTPPFVSALGSDFTALPTITQHIHTPAPSHVLKGEVSIEGATHPISRLIARLFRMPASSLTSPFTTTIELDKTGTEKWSRYFPDKTMQSRLCNPDGEAQTIDECFGPFRFTLKLAAKAEGIDMHLHTGHFLGIPLPGFCLPRITATERAADGKHLFDVTVDLPGPGRLVRYSGWLQNVVTKSLVRASPSG